MGYFTKDGTANSDAAELVPLSADGIRSVLDTWDARYGTDDDGEIGGFWDGHLFFFSCQGDGAALHVRGRWTRALDPEHRGTVAALINTWNTDKLWPKAYFREEDATLGIYGEFSTPLSNGATQAQLDDLMSCALGTTLQLFKELDEQFPAAAAAAERDDD